MPGIRYANTCVLIHGSQSSRPQCARAISLNRCESSFPIAGFGPEQGSTVEHDPVDSARVQRAVESSLGLALGEKLALPNFHRVVEIVRQTVQIVTQRPQPPVNMCGMAA